MAEFNVNKGVGKPAEFKGLHSRYLFIFAGGLLAVFVMFIVMYMASINQWICILFGAAAATVLVWQTFSLNRKHGAHGLMKAQAKRRRPFCLINRKRISRLFTIDFADGFSIPNS